MMPYRTKAVPLVLCVLMCAVAPATFFPRTAFGYVLPPEQLFRFMGGGVAGFETLGITLERIVGEEGNGNDSTRLDVWFSSPDDVDIRFHGETGGQRLSAGNMDFLELFCGKRHRVERFLSGLGIDVSTSAYTRLERTVAYRIGRDTPSSPVFLLEKSRFVPLLLRYEPGRAAINDIVEVGFDDYRPVGEGLFPHEIRFRALNGEAEVYTVVDIRLNEPAPRRF